MLKYRKIYFLISGLLVAASLAALGVFGLNLGIDFTGGSLLEISFEETTLHSNPATVATIQAILEQDLALGAAKVQPSAESYLIRLRDISQDEQQAALSAISETIAPPTLLRFESVGPIIGQELKQSALWQILVVVSAIVLYIAYAFRKVGQLKEGSKISWKFGVTALITLLHDVIITLGVFAVLGKFLGVEIDNSFIAAILLVLGYSVNDTIVVFDRIRENLIHHKYSTDLKGIINKSISETITRSLNTSTTTLLVLFAILLFGGSTIFFFVLALIVGIGMGTYSSIFLASPLLYEWEK